ncbi:MAG: hypothetical protein ACFB6S_14330 [Geminicoccaceae bacterium]
MAKVTCNAVVMGPVSGSDHLYQFDVEDDFMDRPADEIVEAFVDYLHREGELKDPSAYELNSAIKNREKGVIMAIGSLALGAELMPFVAMFSQA